MSVESLTGHATPMADDPIVVRDDVTRLPGDRNAVIAALQAAGVMAIERAAAAIDGGAARGLRPIRALIDAGFEWELIERAALVRQGFEFIDVAAELVDREMLNRMTPVVAERLEALPLGRADDGSVRIAVPDPTQLQVTDDIAHHFVGERVQFVVADRANILNIITTLDHAERAGAVDVAQVITDDAPRVVDINEGADDNGVGRLVRNMIERAASSRASDVHIEPTGSELIVRFRIDGVMHPMASYPMNATPAVVNRLKVMANLDVGERRVPQDGRFEVEAAGRRLDLRIVTLPTSWGVESATIRILDRTRQVGDLDSLGYSHHVRSAYLQLVDAPQGAVLATGPTGSGKTTTLYASLQRIATPDRKVLTVEDPVEYKFPAITQVQVNQKAGLSFARALRSFLRADPDVILVGEIRDDETATTAIQAALTGHLVLATIHATSATGVATRLIEMGVEPFLVSSSLRGMIAQRLVRRLCPQCREPYTPDVAMLKSYPWPGDVPSQLFRARKGGCGRCERTGYSGRFAVAEVVSVDGDLALAIAERRSALQLQELAVAKGTVPMYIDGLGRVAEGATSIEEITRVVMV
ncbi:MAG: GspE/PulE family protein [Acidimicrobiia bacterium]